MLLTELGRRRMKVSELARQTGISRTTLTALYYDRAKGVEFHVVDRICSALLCSVGDLFVCEEDNA
nr:helix-turn-helix transcriptional regulator [uncultured Agathobaculum sp.]